MPNMTHPTRFGASLCIRPKLPPLEPNLRPVSLPMSQQAHASTRPPHVFRSPRQKAQSELRRKANIARQAELLEQRRKILGDPVRGVPTPFVENFANSDAYGHFLNAKEVDTALKKSKHLTLPVLESDRNLGDPETERAQLAQHKKDDERAVAAVSRIVNLSMGGSKDRTRSNIQTCISTFGRHNTDATLPPRPTLNSAYSGNATKTPRVGPDTGSSEVQIAILTAKINVVADMVDKFGHKDKVNKRNLRLLVHRRQKLLKYLQRKERGGGRWQHLVETLGLTDGTWKGEISM